MRKDGCHRHHERRGESRRSGAVNRPHSTAAAWTGADSLVEALRDIQNGAARRGDHFHFTPRQTLQHLRWGFPVDLLGFVVRR